MCGITGVVHLDGRGTVDAEVLGAMTAQIVHRGPDDEGRIVDGPAGFGHRRLSIIDLAGGRQPMVAADGDVWLTYNGEIYNYLELRRELITAGHDFRTNSDTEVLLAAWTTWGPACIERLNGMFAFAIWDRRGADGGGTLHLVRDRMGIKPLYWAQAQGVLVFGSEIKALLAHPAIVAAPDWRGVHQYLTFQHGMGEQTLFEGIRRVEPAHHLTWVVGGSRGGAIPCERRRYWRIGHEIDSHHTEGYFVDRMRWLVQDAVSLRLRSDVPLGAHLSGGLDSSTVASMAASLLGEPIQTFTGGFREADRYDETGWARLVAERGGTVHHEVWPEAQQFVDWLPRLIWHMDEPAAGPGLFPQAMVSELASRHVKVVLGGQGGDEIFGGYARYLVAYLEQCLKGAVMETQDHGEFVVTLESIIPALPQLRQYVPMLRQFWSEGLFEDMDRRYFRLIDRNSGGGLDDLLSSDFRASRDEEAPFHDFRALFSDPETASYLNRMTQFDQRASLPALLHVEDRTSMAVSIESRVPLLDHRIAELVATMPPTVKLKGGELKYVFRRAVRHLVPREILERRDKMGFPVPLQEWYAGPIVGPFVRDTLASRAARERGLIDPDAVDRLLAGSGRYDRRLWGLLCLELWFRTFVDGQPPAAPEAGAAAERRATLSEAGA